MPPKPRKPPPRHPNTRTRNLLIAAGGVIAVVAAVIVVSLVVGGGDDGDTPTPDAAAPTFLDGIPQDGAVLGDPKAGVTLIQFEDLQCPICRSYQEEGFPDIVKEYVRPGKITIRFVGLAFIGEDSEKALRYVLAAGAQGKLWDLAAALYANQGEENSGWVTDDLLERLAGEVGLDWDTLQRDAAGSDVARQAQEMAAEGNQRQIPGTPTFYVQVGTDEPYEVQPKSFAIESFRPIFDDALSG